MFSIDIGGWSIPALSPPVGILLVALFTAERRRWPLLVLAASIGILIAKVALHGQPWLPATGFCLLTGVEAGVAAWLLQRAVDAPFALARVAHVWALLVIAALVPMIAGFIAAGMLAQITDGASFLPAWRAWWVSDSLGMLLAAPLAFACMEGPTAFVSGPGRWRVAEAVVVLAGAILVVEMVFGEGLPPLLRVPSYILPFFLWGAFRLQPAGTFTTVCAVCMIALWHTASGVGPFALVDSTTADWILRAQGGIGVICVSMLLLSSVVAERNQVARERAVLLTELQQALVEIRTLRGLIPICAWCHKVRDDAGFWQGIETYLHAHTHATFSHSICPECNTDMQSEIQDEIRSNAQ